MPMTPDERRHWDKLGGIADDARKPGSESFCRDLEQRGLARCYDSMFGNLYFTLTEEGRKAFYGEQ